MSRHFKFTLVLLAFVAAGYWYAPTLHKRSARLDLYLCDQCAMEREVIRRWWLSIETSNTDTKRNTALSLAMRQPNAAPCDHHWVLVYWDYHGHNVSGHGAVGSSFLRYVLTSDNHIPPSLVAFANSRNIPPSRVWKIVFHHLTDITREEQFALEDRMIESDSIEDSLGLWLKSHYDELEKAAVK